MLTGFLLTMRGVLPGGVLQERSSE